MSKNQYVISDSLITFDEIEYLSCRFLDYYVSYSDSLPCCIAENLCCNVMILGEIMSPWSPALSNLEIAESLIKNLDLKSLIQEVDRYFGRFVILCKIHNEIVIINDACSLKSVYINTQKGIIISSSVKLIYKALGKQYTVADKYSKLVFSKEFVKKEMAFIGDEDYDGNTKKILPNYFYDLNTLTLKRKSFSIPTVKADELLEFTASTLIGAFDAVFNRFDHILQPLTAGIDSRILLASSKKYTDAIQYYIFDTFENSKHQDLYVSKNLANNLNLKFRKITPAPLSEDFITIFKNQHTIPRILPKTRFIEYHFRQNYLDKTVNINGNGLEIARCYFGASNTKVSKDMLITLSGYRDLDAALQNNLLQWYDDSYAWAQEYDISLLDLFYWEQRMGNWGSLYPMEQDMAVTEISPFNNRGLLFNLLQCKASKRKGPNYKFYNELIENLWKETMAEKINPDDNRFKSYLESYAFLRYRLIKLKRLIRR